MSGDERRVTLPGGDERRVKLPSGGERRVKLPSGGERWLIACVPLLAIIATGCGTTRGYDATEQLVVSDAVDSSVSKIDFRPLSNRRVFLDTRFLRHVKGAGFVNADYVTSSLRQQIVGAGCLIEDRIEDAEVVIEARLGTLGLDDHSVLFGIPKNNAVSSVAAALPGSPALPTIPEISLSKRESREAAAKVVAFAYDRKTRMPIWQSGVHSSTATARDTWVMGVGPFQGGSVREQTRLAGSQFGYGDDGGSPPLPYDRPPVDYNAETRFDGGYPVMSRDLPGGGLMDQQSTSIAEVPGDGTLR